MFSCAPTVIDLLMVQKYEVHLRSVEHSKRDVAPPLPADACREMRLVGWADTMNVFAILVVCGQRIATLTPSSGECS